MQVIRMYMFCTRLKAVDHKLRPSKNLIIIVIDFSRRVKIKINHPNVIFSRIHSIFPVIEASPKKFATILPFLLTSLLQTLGVPKKAEIIPSTPAQDNACEGKSKETVSPPFAPAQSLLLSSQYLELSSLTGGILFAPLSAPHIIILNTNY
jgi:hypothetical protein